MIGANEWALALVMLASALAAAGIGLVALWLLPVPAATAGKSVFIDHDAAPTFLFDGEVLIDSTSDARALLAVSPVKAGPWPRLMAYLAPRFADLEAQLKRLPAEGAITLSTGKVGMPLLLSAENNGGLTRISLIDATNAPQGSTSDPLSQHAMLEELSVLRDTVAAAPILVWRENPQGEVVWANAAYMLHAFSVLEDGRNLGWPLPRLFDRNAAVQGAKNQRQCLTRPRGEPPLWFDLASRPEAGGLLLFATPADAAVQAETALRDFMQTLTKTFAQLPIGLAIFDRQRKLQLFNPALMDLTTLPPDFLSMRPSLLSVLDAMRDRKMLPEPKDYRDWRRQIVDMERAAASGLYEETWSLPDGQTYKVVGRPHPNGALALMIEDISNEMLRTRRYRADLELGQSVIDEVDEAIAVFAQSGQLVMSNNAYAAIWGHDPAELLGDSTVRSLSAHWRAQTAPSAIWAEVEDYVATVGDRASWKGEARLLDGRLVSCRFAPLATGATLALFRPLPATEAGQPRLAESDGLRRA